MFQPPQNLSESDMENEIRDSDRYEEVKMEWRD
jgi:hypothetical protein